MRKRGTPEARLARAAPVASTPPAATPAARQAAADPVRHDRTRLRRVSVIVPAYDEADAIVETVERIRRAVQGHAGALYEIVVVNDGSTDGTGQAARRAGARVVNHPYNIGNGGAIKTGIRHARGDLLVFIDGDGQHDPALIPAMVDRLARYDMVVGARRRRGQASLARAVANALYNGFATYVTAFPIRDLTSGFRAVRGTVARRFVYLLPNTFSYPTTLTLAVLRAGFSLDYVAVDAARRHGRSKIRPLEDGARFVMIILKIATFFAPLRIFLPAAAAIFFTGLGYYLYTFLTEHRFTNMSVLLMVLSFLVFSLGLISDQIAQLRFDRSED